MRCPVLRAMARLRPVMPQTVVAKNEGNEIWLPGSHVLFHIRQNTPIIFLSCNFILAWLNWEQNTVAKFPGNSPRQPHFCLPLNRACHGMLYRGGYRQCTRK